MLVIEADIHEYVGMSYVDKNILGPLVHMCTCFYHMCVSVVVYTAAMYNCKPECESCLLYTLCYYFPMELGNFICFQKPCWNCSCVFEGLTPAQLYIVRYICYSCRKLQCACRFYNALFSHTD